jgi:hypothetical protein
LRVRTSGDAIADSNSDTDGASDSAASDVQPLADCNSDSYADAHTVTRSNADTGAHAEPDAIAFTNSFPDADPVIARAAVSHRY